MSDHPPFTFHLSLFTLKSVNLTRGFIGVLSWFYRGHHRPLPLSFRNHLVTFTVHHYSSFNFPHVAIDAVLCQFIFFHNAVLFFLCFDSLFLKDIYFVYMVMLNTIFHRCAFELHWCCVKDFTTGM